jgi:hypothetical protein
MTPSLNLICKKLTTEEKQERGIKVSIPVLILQHDRVQLMEIVV